MRFVLSGGGTAGHINPALALAEVLQSRGHEVFFAGTPQGVEARLVPQAGLPFQAFEAHGFNRHHPTTLVTSGITVLKSTKIAKRWLEDIKPDAVVGFGGYVSVPVTSAAKQLHIPVVLHEQNSVMGLANREISKFASRVCLTYACAGAGIDASKVTVTGNPVRKAIMEATSQEGRTLLSLPENAKVLLVFGGSLGARHINTALCQMKDMLLAIDNLYIIHITGPKEYDTVVADLSLNDEEQKRWQVMGYQNRMAETLAASDLIISRAGASSLAEIAARGIPALLVPFPYATADHQTVNAKTLVEAGCALMIADDQVETPRFRELVHHFVTDDAQLNAMREAARDVSSVNAAELLADVVVDAAREPYFG